MKKLVLLVIAVFFCLHLEGNSDLFWHLKTGELILRDFAIPRTDPFSFTMFGNVWVNHEWIPAVLFQLVYRLGGFIGLSILSGLVGLGLAAAICAALQRVSGSETTALFLTIIVFAIGAPRFQLLRPDLFAFLFFALLLQGLNASAGIRADRLRWLIPLIALWANVHASAIIAPPIVLLYTVVALLDGRWRGEGAKAIGQRFGTVAVCFLAPIANPHLWRIYAFPFEHLSQRFSIAVTSDWAPLSWWLPSIDVAAWGLAILFTACIAAAAIRPKAIDVPAFAVAIACAIPGFLMLRFVPFAAIALAFFLAGMMAGTAPISWRTIALAIVLFVIAPIGLFRGGPFYGLQQNVEGIQFVVGRSVNVGFDQNEFPVEAVDYLERIRTKSALFNDMGWGGYLIWRRWPDRKVFIDTRTPVYGDAFIKQYSDALFDPKAFDVLATRYSIQYVLYDLRDVMTRGGPLRFLLRDPHWQTVFRSKNAIIFGRAGER